MKMVSLKIDDSILAETEKILTQNRMPRNRYINEAIKYYTRIQSRILLKGRLKTESELVKKNSMSILKDFEEIDLLPSDF